MKDQINLKYRFSVRDRTTEYSLVQGQSDQVFSTIGAGEFQKLALLSRSIGEMPSIR